MAQIQQEVDDLRGTIKRIARDRDSTGRDD